VRQRLREFVVGFFRPVVLCVIFVLGLWLWRSNSASEYESVVAPPPSLAPLRSLAVHSAVDIAEDSGQWVSVTQAPDGEWIVEEGPSLDEKAPVAMLDYDARGRGYEWQHEVTTTYRAELFAARFLVLYADGLPVLCEPWRTP